MDQPNPIPELTPYLKQLRLSGLLETLAQRNREAIENKLSYPEFLALLITDEAARRDQKKYTHRLRKAGFKGDKTLEGFDFAFNPGIDQRQIRPGRWPVHRRKGRGTHCRAVRYRQEPHRPGARPLRGAQGL